MNMRIVIQRVNSASVKVDDEIIGRIGVGLLVYLGVGNNDSDADAKYIANKITGLRIFTDSAGKMNKNVIDVAGEVLLVSQFTLYGDCRKGRRPGFDAAGEPTVARELYELVGRLIRANGVEVACGQFAACMEVAGVNNGPVTLILDSEKLF